MTTRMVGIDVEEFQKVRWREVLTEHKEGGMEEKAFHSENVTKHLIKSKRAKAGDKKIIIMTKKRTSRSQSSYHRKCKTNGGGQIRRHFITQYDCFTSAVCNFYQLPVK